MDGLSPDQRPVFAAEMGALRIAGQNDGECDETAFRRWCGADDLADGLFGVFRRVQVVASLERNRAGHAEEMALDLAEIAGAGNDFLARIAALVEADAADLVEISHLRHELFTGGGGNPGQGGDHIETAPDWNADRTGFCR